MTPSHLHQLITVDLNPRHTTQILEEANLQSEESHERRKHTGKPRSGVGGSVEGGSGRGARGSPRGAARHGHGRGASSTPGHGHGGRARGHTALAVGKSSVGNERLLLGGLGVTGRVVGERAGLVSADALELGTLGLDDGGLGGAAVVEEGAQSLADGLDVRLGDTEGGSGESDLGDEVAHLVGVEDHEPFEMVVSRDFPSFSYF